MLTLSLSFQVFLASTFNDVEEKLQEIGDQVEIRRANHIARKRMQAARRTFLDVEAEYEDHGTNSFSNACIFFNNFLVEAVLEEHIGQNDSEVHLHPCSKGFLFSIFNGKERKPFICLRPGSVKAAMDMFKFKASIPNDSFMEASTQTGSFGFNVKGAQYCCHVRFFVHDRYIYPYQQMILRLWSGPLEEHAISIPWGIYILDKKYEGCSLDEYNEKDFFPPPWVYQRDCHPYGTPYKMGRNYLEIFDTWWDKHDFSLEEKISYFMRWPPPPRWLGWVAFTLGPLYLEPFISDLNKFIGKFIDPVD